VVVAPLEAVPVAMTLRVIQLIMRRRRHNGLGCSRRGRIIGRRPHAPNYSLHPPKEKHTGNFDGLVMNKIA